MPKRTRPPSPTPSDRSEEMIKPEPDTEPITTPVTPPAKKAQKQTHTSTPSRSGPSTPGAVKGGNRKRVDMMEAIFDHARKTGVEYIVQAVSGDSICQ